jgi:hypothetical protein
VVTTVDQDGKTTSQRVYASDPTLKAVVESKLPPLPSPSFAEMAMEAGPLGIPMAVYGVATLGGLWWVLK